MITTILIEILRYLLLLLVNPVLPFLLYLLIVALSSSLLITPIYNCFFSCDERAVSPFRIKKLYSLRRGTCKYFHEEQGRQSNHYNNEIKTVNTGNEKKSTKAIFLKILNKPINSSS